MHSLGSEKNKRFNPIFLFLAAALCLSGCFSLDFDGRCGDMELGEATMGNYFWFGE